MVTEVFTIGHSNRTMDDFLKLLMDHKVKILVDVRRYPRSKKFPQFTADKIKEALQKFGIEYFYLGETLGGYRKKGYEYYTMTEPFQEGIKKLLSIVKKGKTAIMCSERFPWNCHRRFISFELQRNGIYSINILDPGKDWIPQKQTKLTFEPEY